ncbi:dUTPase [Bacillus phage MG-B1]|uniref:dUTPase n=1 Tax=Bacillus phage MG-B1 TaxID=1309583 RepID=M4W9N7_9CAUD|nr:nucleoside triphosphate pyrophosphohydrolase [Bacillus phage MG-B1]AGI10593.1 dUTPase [Bacillus phage MG-B1]
MMLTAFKLQTEVDELIQEKISVSFQKTTEERKIAFHVELGELANEIGFFKYWKKSHVKDDFRIKDEWADCLAFLNSLSITYGFEGELIPELIGGYNVSIDRPEYYYKNLMYNKLYDYVDFECAYKDLFKLGLTLGYSLEDLFEAYEGKTKENIRRAKEGY